MRSALYCRVSTDEQARHGFSLDAQQEACMRYIQEAKHELFKIYVDDGYSAKNMNRPALQEMLEDIRNKKIDLVVIWRIDRLTRRTMDGLNMVHEIFNKYGVSFATIMERHDLSTSQGRWMFTVSLANAQNERELIGERVAFGQAKKAQRGFRVSLGAIYGYDVVEGELKVNEAEADVVRQIFDFYVYKGWGYGKISKTLNARGISSKKSVWWPATIKGILKNPTYISKNAWTPKNSEPIITDGTHEAIITAELFYLAQQKLERKANLEMSRSSYNYPFSSIVKCGSCGASYTAYYTKKPEDRKAYCNYRCSNKKSQACSAPDIAEFKLEKLFFDYFSNYYLESHVYTPEPSKDAQKYAEKEIKRIEKEIEKLEKRKTNLLDDLGDRIISRDDYRKAMVDINEKTDALKQELILIKPTEVKVSRAPDETINFIRNLERDWVDMAHENRKFIIQLMFKKIVIVKNESKWSIQSVEVV